MLKILLLLRLLKMHRLLSRLLLLLQMRLLVLLEMHLRLLLLGSILLYRLLLYVLLVLLLVVGRVVPVLGSLEPAQGRRGRRGCGDQRGRTALLFVSLAPAEVADEPVVHYRPSLSSFPLSTFLAVFALLAVAVRPARVPVPLVLDKEGLVFTTLRGRGADSSLFVGRRFLVNRRCLSVGVCGQLGQFGVHHRVHIHCHEL